MLLLHLYRGVPLDLLYDVSNSLYCMCERVSYLSMFVIWQPNDRYSTAIWCYNKNISYQDFDPDSDSENIVQ
jgi:hypothetical protein